MNDLNGQTLKLETAKEDHARHERSLYMVSYNLTKYQGNHADYLPKLQPTQQSGRAYLR
jgi:hypothetical protein